MRLVDEGDLVVAHMHHLQVGIRSKSGTLDVAPPMEEIGVRLYLVRSRGRGSGGSTGDGVWV